MIDQSWSMNDSYAGTTHQKKDVAANTVNTVIYELVSKCEKSNVIKPRCYLATIGYGESAESIVSATDSIDILGQNPLERKRKITKPVLQGDSYIDREDIINIWLEAKANDQTPMDKAFDIAHKIIEDWINDPEHEDCFPPIIVNITDGRPTHPEPTKKMAEQIRSLKVNDGDVLLFNVHIPDKKTKEIVFPSDPQELDDPYAQYLFEISSPIPQELLGKIQEIVGADVSIQSGARGLVFSASANTLLKILQFGTTVAID